MIRYIRMFLFFSNIVCCGYVFGNSADSLKIASEKGIRFEKSVGWKGVLEKAKSEGKFIFLDCFATWCGPCKGMDNRVYVREEVGGFINSKFISVKVQMDTTDKDGAQEQVWYKDAYELAKKYNISALPTYLFFSPDGTILHKGIGAKSEQDFLSMARDALDHEKQYYSLLLRYVSGSLSYRDYPKLISSSKENNDNEISKRLLRDYFDNYLDKLDSDSLLKYDKFDFIFNNRQDVDVSSRICSFVNTNMDTIDLIMGKRAFSKGLLYDIVYKEIYVNLMLNIKLSMEPDWEALKNRIFLNYGSDIAKLAIVDAKLRWYKANKMWSEYTSMLVIQVDNYISILPNRANFLYLNASALHVFEHSFDSTQIRSALSWIDLALLSTPDNLRAAVADTKAGLLYKLGRRDEAISLGEQVVKLNEDAAKKEGREPGNLFKQNLLKMRLGLPTWPVLE